MSPLDCAPCGSQVKLILGGKILAYPSQSFWLPLLSSKIQHCSLAYGGVSPVWASDLFMQISVTETEAYRSEACTQLFGGGVEEVKLQYWSGGHPQAKELVCDYCRRIMTQSQRRVTRVAILWKFKERRIQ